MPPVVMLARVSTSGRHQSEVGDFAIWATAWQMQNPDKIADILHAPIKGVVPAPCARNRAVSWARQKHADILMMIDDDMIPDPKFFAAAINFLNQHHGPAAIAMPYCSAPPAEDVLVFEWGAFESQAASARWKLERIRREDAIRRTGIERCANVGTGCIAYDMRCFDVYGPIYFDYGYNENHTNVTETEDCWAHRHMANARIPLYVDWDHWSGHAKTKIVPKPSAIDQEYIDSFHVREAKAELRRELLAPTDVEGLETDMGGVYFGAVEDAPQEAGFVEVGCWKGASTILLAKLIQQSGKRILLHAVDTFRGSPDESYHRRMVSQHGGSLRKLFEENVQRHNVAAGIRIVEMESTEAAKQFADGSLDFVYVDAQHSYEAVKADITAWLPKVKPGGTLAGHDIDFDSVAKAVRELVPGFAVVGRSWVWRK